MSYRLGCKKGTVNLENQTYHNFKHEKGKNSPFLNSLSHLQEFASMNGYLDLITVPAAN